MRIAVRSLVDAILGRIPGKTSQLDTATRIMIDADFSFSREWWLAPPLIESERDDDHLFKPMESSEDAAFFEQLLRTVNEAQDREAEDERRLYPPVNPVQFPPRHADGIS